jgi:hypothetical protein
MSFIKVLVESKDHLKHGARGCSCEEETTEQDLFMSGWTALDVMQALSANSCLAEAS